VGIKVNCQHPASSTHWQVVSAIIAGLAEMGVAERNIVVWDGEGDSLARSPMGKLMDVFPRVRLSATDKSGDFPDRDKVMDIQGKPCCLSRLATDAAHLINVPVLKNHTEAGISFALKNHVGSGGANRSDRQKIFHDPPEAANRAHQILGRGKPNAESIALINAAPDIKNKTRLIVGDALFGIYLRGPGGEPEFAYNGLIVGTDPVATDHQARLIIENQRRRNNLPVVPSLHIERAIKLGLGAAIEEMKVSRWIKRSKDNDFIEEK
jgi:uncharacterized protein (DUF362 family)